MYTITFGLHPTVSNYRCPQNDYSSLAGFSRSVCVGVEIGGDPVFEPRTSSNQKQNSRQTTKQHRGDFGTTESPAPLSPVSREFCFQLRFCRSTEVFLHFISTFVYFGVSVSLPLHLFRIYLPCMKLFYSECRTEVLLYVNSS